MLERSLQIISEVGDTRVQAFAKLHLAVARWQSGKPQVVRELAREAVEASHLVNNPLSLLLSVWLLTLLGARVR